MDHKTQLICSKCRGGSFTIKYEVQYEYSYVIDSDSPGLKNTKEFLPYLFDNREQKESSQYIVCRNCNSKYPIYLNEWNKGISINDLQMAINSAH